MTHTVTRAATAAPTARTGRALNPQQRQAAIESALSTAWCLVRSPGATPAEQAASMHAAIARTNRALTLLKAASKAADAGRV